MWTRTLFAVVLLCGVSLWTPSWAQHSPYGPNIGKETARVGVGASIVRLVWSPDGRRVVVLSTDFVLSSVSPDRATRDWKSKALGFAQYATIAFVDGGARI